MHSEFYRRCFQIVTAAILGYGLYKLLDPLLGVSLRAVIDGDGDLRETRFTQPAIFAIGYALAQYWLSLGVQPAALVGHSVGLHPVWLMFALFAFGYLFGFVGLLLAVPLAAAAGVLIRFAVRRYRGSPLYTGSRPV